MLDVNQDLIKKDVSTDLQSIPMEFLREIWIKDWINGKEDRKEKKKKS